MGKDVIIACDFSSKEETLQFLDKFTGKKPYVKIGMELFYAEGPAIVREIKQRGHQIFLDLKLHDIPNTVMKAMSVLSNLDVDMCNLHAGGTVPMMEAAIKAVKTVDECTGRVVNEIIKHGGKCIITADHGNADQMLDPVHGGAFTAHTTNPVPVIVVDPEHPKYELRQGGRLCDLCPTMLTLMKLPQPKEMTGKSLIIG